MIISLKIILPSSFHKMLNHKYGDQIRYTAVNQLSGLVSGDYYYVKKVTNSEIKLYISLSLLQDDMTEMIMLDLDLIQIRLEHII